MDGVEDSLVRYNFVRIFIIFLFVHLTVPFICFIFGEETVANTVQEFHNHIKAISVEEFN